MNWPEVRVLRGTNVWAPNPMLEVELDLNETAADAAGAERAARRLRAALPELGETGAGGDPALRLAWGLVRLTLALQRLAGSPVTAGAVRPARPGVFRIAAEFEEEALGHASLEAARRLWLAALQDSNLDVQPDLTTLRELAHEVRLGPSTGAIVAAAKRRGIPAVRLNGGNLIQLGHGAHRRRIWTAETDRTGAIAEAIAQDKDQTRALLRGVGVPVPEGRPVRDAEDAWAAAEEIGVPVVVKPRHGNHGRGVTTNVFNREQVERAFAEAREHGNEVVVERFVAGRDFRLLVVGGRLVAAALREPPAVVGDGRSTVAELVDALNRDPRRSDGHATALSVVKLDAIALGVLAEQGLAPDAVPDAGRRVLIRRNANLSSGGTATDVTDEVHPRAAASAVAAARAVGLDIAGVDVVAQAIDQPLEQSGGVVVEVNAGPGLRMHLEPSAGTPRPVGDEIVRMLFPAGTTARVPLAVVLGTNGGTTARLLAHLLTGAGHLVGLACRDGRYVGGRQIDSRDGTDAQSARALPLNPRVTAAVLEVAPERAEREGLGFGQCDVAVVMEVGRGTDRPEERRLVESIVVRAVASAGAAVLNADDPLVAAMASACPGPAHYFARAESEKVRAHRGCNGRAVLVREGRLVFAQGPAEAVLPLGELRQRLGAQGGCKVEDVLAAAGAAWALGLPGEAIRAGLTTFLMEG